MKKILICLFAISLTITTGLLVFTDPAKPVNPLPISKPLLPKAWTVEEALDLITVEDATKWLTYISSDELEGRMSGKKGNKIAAQWAKDKFESFGLKAEFQKFSIRKMNNGPQNEVGDDFTQNIIATLPGETDRVIIIGAHIDHVGWGPSMSTDGVVGIHNGADDNGSGATGVLLTAKAMSKLKLKHTIVFLLFSGEEMGLIGSKHYVSKLSEEQLKKIDLMINYDMIGRLKSNGLVECVGARETSSLTEMLSRLEVKYPPLKLEPKTGNGQGNSDHAPFFDRRVPVCFFFTGMHPQYHKVSDKVNLINFDGLIKIAKVGMELAIMWDSK